MIRQPIFLLFAPQSNFGTYSVVQCDIDDAFASGSLAVGAARKQSGRVSTATLGSRGVSTTVDPHQNGGSLATFVGALRSLVEDLLGRHHVEEETILALARVWLGRRA